MPEGDKSLKKGQLTPEHSAPLNSEMIAVYCL